MYKNTLIVITIELIGQVGCQVDVKCYRHRRSMFQCFRPIRSIENGNELS